MARAKRGGEYGANGEWYEGGTFLNTTPDNAKGRPKARVRTPRKEQIEPGVWQLPPDGQFAIFHATVGTTAQVVGGSLRPFAPGVAYYGDRVHGHAVAELCERYNAGERFAGRT